MQLDRFASRPLKVFVRPNSTAEQKLRRLAARRAVPPKESAPEAAQIASGFHPRLELNLVDHGGKIVPHLTYTNFYVGGKASWSQQDIQRIDTHLSKAMSDRRLNNVLLQYFRGAPTI